MRSPSGYLGYQDLSTPIPPPAPRGLACLALGIPAITVELSPHASVEWDKSKVSSRSGSFQIAQRARGLCTRRTRLWMADWVLP